MFKASSTLMHLRIVQLEGCRHRTHWRDYISQKGTPQYFPGGPKGGGWGEGGPGLSSATQKQISGS